MYNLVTIPNPLQVTNSDLLSVYCAAYLCIHCCSLWDNNIGDVGARDLADCLKTNTSLTSLGYAS